MDDIEERHRRNAKIYSANDIAAARAEERTKARREALEACVREVKLNSNLFKDIGDYEKMLHAIRDIQKEAQEGGAK